MTKKPDPKPEEKPVEVDVEKMPVRLFNVLTMWNFYILAKDHDDARAAASAIIRADAQKCFEQVAYEVLRDRNINEAWRDEMPWLSESIPAQPEETTLQAFQRLYTKRG